MRRLILAGAVVLVSCSLAKGQGFLRTTYHDEAQLHIKEQYYVKDTISNVLHGSYVSYFLNGKIESKGQFENNETAGAWEFYYENGRLKMRGNLLKNSNQGKWEYFFESGGKAMEGTVNGKFREGEWKVYYENGQLKESGNYAENKRTGYWRMFYEDGTLRGEIEYTDDFGRFIEYYPSHKVQAEGPKSGNKQVGHWRYFDENGVLSAEGDYANDKKNGTWITYFPSGQVSSRGSYRNDVPEGMWEYFFEDGRVSSSGQYLGGRKHAYWSAYNEDGSLKSEVSFDKGTGQYREYYKDGNLKVKGMIVNEKKEGTWEYFYPDGKLEGVCEFTEGRGTYRGFYPNGTLQTKGEIVDDKRMGTWELYETDGTLSGYYKPFYGNSATGREIQELAIRPAPAPKKVRKFTYFDERFNEFKGLIIGGNPVMMLVGTFPVGMEFYFEGRLGHEFEFTGIRDPFFEPDDKIPVGKRFQRGYAIALKQKMYNPVKIGMWYFGQEIRFTNSGHFVNVVIPQAPDNILTASSYEQRIEYGWLLGYRIMQRNNHQGFTIDAFVSADIGYRNFDVEPGYSEQFQGINQSALSHSFNFGLNFGNVFSYR